VRERRITMPKIEHLSLPEMNFIVATLAAAMMKTENEFPEDTDPGLGLSAFFTVTYQTSPVVLEEALHITHDLFDSFVEGDLRVVYGAKAFNMNKVLSLVSALTSGTLNIVYGRFLKRYNLPEEEKPRGILWTWEGLLLFAAALAIEGSSGGANTGTSTVLYKHYMMHFITGLTHIEDIEGMFITPITKGRELSKTLQDEGSNNLTFLERVTLEYVPLLPKLQLLFMAGVGGPETGGNAMEDLFAELSDDSRDTGYLS